jgi:hypothetical protein
MTMMKTLILVCAVGLARGDCGIDTAVSVIQGPEAGNAVMCGLHGQAYLAETVLSDYLNGEHYLKIACTAGERQPLPRHARDTNLTAAALQVR